MRSWVLILSLCLVSCSNNENHNDVITQVDTATTTIVQPPPPPLKNDTLVVSSPAAVMYQPDSLMIEKRIKKGNEDEFRAGMGDYIYYMNTASEYLEQQGLRLMDATDKKYIRFDGSYPQLIKLDTLPELWGIWLFDPRKKPYAADITIMEEEYRAYF